MSHWWVKPAQVGTAPVLSIPKIFGVLAIMLFPMISAPRYFIGVYMHITGLQRIGTSDLIVELIGVCLWSLYLAFWFFVLLKYLFAKKRSDKAVERADGQPRASSERLRRH